MSISLIVSVPSLLLSLLVLIAAARRVNWQALYIHRVTQHLFFASVVTLSVLASLRAGILPGLEFYVLGYTAITLMMGWALALLATFLVQILMVATGHIEILNLGYVYLSTCVPAVFFTYYFYRLVYLRLHHNPFIYILVAGFFNAGFTHAVSDILHAFSAWWQQGLTLQVIWHDYLRYLPLMMFPEGVINGMFIAGMVAFHTRWLSTFDETSYFK